MAVFAGGDYTADGGTAEAEGLVVVAGDATFAKSGGGVFNIGRVGAGSGILPASGQVMLAVGGDLHIAKGTTLDIGSGLTTGPGYGGGVRAGGTIDAKGPLDTNGGEQRSRVGKAAALDPYAAFDATLRDQSAALGALRPTGTAQRSGGTVTFRSTGPSTGTLQVFELASADLDGASTFVFESIPAEASVLVNVTGTHPVSVSPMAVGYNGDRVDVYSSAHFGEASAKVLYNLRETPKVTLGGGGNFIGSLLAPKASADLTASTNGRLFVGGDLRTHGSGNESHNYPWTGAPAFSCSPTPVPQPSTPPVPTPAPSPTPSVPGQTPPATPSTPPTPGTPTGPGTPSTPGTPNTPSAPGSRKPSAPPTSARPTTPGGAAPAPSPTPDRPAPGTSLAFTGSTGTFLIAGTGVATLVIGGGVLVALRRRRGSTG
ncbi:choice-of-anchor A family protein [Kitasatospora sp. NPDC096147]|uniref:choice-of-anchor A family protein n=1 Tax=Kitasatospora sp. NPDC096147 TaxID=3364093 RepID=UPI003807CD6A